jgi:hypothetical protein
MDHLPTIQRHTQTQQPNDLRRVMEEAIPILEIHLQRVADAPNPDKVKTAEEIYPLIESLSGVERSRAEKDLQRAFGGPRAVAIEAIRKAITEATATQPVSDQTGRHNPYKATDDGLIWSKTTKDGPAPIQLTNFRARIVADIYEDDGIDTNRAYAIEAQLNGQTSHLQISAHQFSMMNWPIEHLGAHAIVFPGFGLKDHARVAIQMLSPRIAVRRIFMHSGWRQLDASTWAYLHGDGALGADGLRADITVVLPEGLKPFVLPAPPAGGALVGAIHASLRFLDLAPHPITVPLYAALWRAVLGAADFGEHVSGPTGEGKTELAALIQQHFGVGFNARLLPGSWSSTGNALEALAFAAKDAILVIDDFVPGGSQADVARLHREADRILRAQGNHAGRTRMRPDATLRAAKPPRGLILSTGEDIPRGQSLRARLQILEVSPGDVDWNCLSAAQRNAVNGAYAQAMAGFIQWLAPRYGSILQTLRYKIDELRQQAYQDSQHRRTPDIMANLAVGLRYFLTLAEEARAITTDESGSLWQRCWMALGGAAKPQTHHQQSHEPTRRFVDLLAAAIASGRAHIANTSCVLRNSATSIFACPSGRGSVPILASMPS